MLQKSLNLGKVDRFDRLTGWITAMVLWVAITMGFAPDGMAQSKPEWLLNRPTDPSYYIGIGGVVKSEHEVDYVAKAREQAQADLVSQIEVTVSASQFSKVTETESSVEELFENAVRSQAQATIENVELVDTYESGDQYWVYLKLSRAKYAARLAEKVLIAKTSGLTSYQKGRAQYEAGNYPNALSLLMNGFGDVAPYVDRLDDVRDGDRTINLFSELRSLIQLTLDQMRIRNPSGPKEATIGQKGDSPFEVTVLGKDSDKPLEGLPVSYRFIRGGGEITSPVITGIDGKCTALLSKLTGKEKLQILVAEIGLMDMLSESQRTAFTEGLIAGFTIPNHRFVLKVAGQPIYLDYSEDFLGRNEDSGYLKPILTSHFSNEGFSFVEDPSAAELMLEVSVKTKKSSEMYGQYTSRVSLTLGMTSLVTGEAFATESLNDVKGIQLSYERAAAKAFETVQDSLERGMLPRLITRIRR